MVHLRIVNCEKENPRATILEFEWSQEATYRDLWFPNVAETDLRRDMTPSID